MIVLGLDPSLTATGWGAIRASGSRLTYIAAGTLRPPAAGSMPARLATLFAAVADILRDQRPDSAACEEVFSNKNPQSTLKLGQARGAVLAALGAARVPCAEYAPRFVKKALVGTGAADKQQVRAMVERLLPGARADSLDASDALAVAICHANMAASARLVMQA